MEQLPMAPLPPVLSTQEVAELLRLSDRSVLEMVKAGALPAHRAPGRRRYHFLAEEVLAAVTSRSAPAATGDSVVIGSTPALSAPPPPAVDPCDVWGAAPTRGSGWPRRCVERWMELASAAGLVAEVRVVNDAMEGRSAGMVELDNLSYLVLAGPRQRVRCVTDDGEPGWSLIDSVWVEPDVSRHPGPSTNHAG